jgi:hypothetical protein
MSHCYHRSFNSVFLVLIRHICLGATDLSSILNNLSNHNLNPLLNREHRAKLTHTCAVSVNSIWVISLQPGNNVCT